MLKPSHRSPAGLVLVVTVPDSGTTASLTGALAALPWLTRDGARYEGCIPPDCSEPTCGDGRD